MKKTTLSLWLVITVTMDLAVFTGQAATTFNIVPSFGTTQGALEFATYAQSTVDLLKANGTLPTKLTHVTPENLMTRPDGHGVVWWWIVVSAASSGETVSLADISVVLSSSDDNNTFDKTVSFSGTAYSSFAIGIRTDGTEITSGSANQQAHRVIVAVGSKSFPTSSSADEQAVRDWFYQFRTWSTTAVVTANGASASFTLMKSPARLMSWITTGKLFVSTENSLDPLSYGIQTSTNLSGLWTSAGTIRAGQTNDLGLVTNQPSLFVRYAPILVAQ